MRRDVVLLAACFALAACKETVAVECRLNSDCPNGESCRSGSCVPECRTDRDCEDTERCLDGVCVRRGVEVRFCQAADECDVGQTCVGGVCAVVSFVTPEDAGLVRDTGVARDAGTTEPDANEVDGGASNGLPRGASCARASECASRLCIAPSGSTTGRCTARCTGDLDCVYPEKCREVAGSGSFCAYGASLSPVGTACGVPEECASGLCLAFGSSSLCTQVCSPLPSCPSGLTCVPVADGKGGAMAVCAPGSGGGFGGGCTSGAECASSLCVGVQGAGAGMCTAYCDLVPCPRGYACTNVDDGAGGAVPVCAPDGATNGPLGAPCSGASGCASGLCLHDARTGGAFCTKTCSALGDCASLSGTTCVQLEGGARICGPP